ncbi:MAG: hypothetical protein IJK23_04550 [Clostridia bacterium]|nr:hypothetical protein [Clostridia bacterium]
MGLLSKFLKGEGAKVLEDVGKDLLSKALGNEAQKPAAQQSASSPAPAQSDYESDNPWDIMPAEENQYSFAGPYTAYFSGIFASEFPAYNVTQEPAGSSTVCTFRQGGAKALVVELKSEKSEANRLRTECSRAGIPYLRFYYDHEGWWNTRSYVVNRVRAALGM